MAAARNRVPSSGRCVLGWLPCSPAFLVSRSGAWFREPAQRAQTRGEAVFPAAGDHEWRQALQPAADRPLRDGEGAGSVVGPGERVFLSRAPMKMPSFSHCALTISNGIGWSPDASMMYLNDSGTGCLDAFRFDGPSGAITDRRTLVHVDQPGVVPDGLTVDGEGGIWVALWNGGAVQSYAPDGTLLTSVRLPAQRPTSCAFGGFQGPHLGAADRGP